MTRTWKITWSAKGAHIELSFFTALRTTLAGDFGASITPARSGAEPARFLVLAEAGVPTSSALVVLFAELFLEAVSLATVVVVVAIVFRHAGVVLGALVGVVGAYAGFVIGLAAVAVMLSRRHVGDAPPVWARRLGLGGRRWDVIQRWFARSGRRRRWKRSWRRPKQPRPTLAWRPGSTRFGRTAPPFAVC